MSYDVSDHVESSWFDETFSKIEENKRLRDSGGYNSIPFGLTSLDKHVRIMRGVQYLLTANSGVGKTKLAKFLFVNQPYKFIKEHPELGLKLKIFYFALEESRHEFMLGLISNRLRTKHGISIGAMELMSMTDDALSDGILEKVMECREYFREMEQYIEVIDHVSNPFGIFKHVRDYARQNGKFYFKGEQVDPGQPGVMYDNYIANDPNEYVIIITDHLSLLQPEATGDTNTLHGAMSKFSSEYCRKHLTKHFKYIVVGTQQQASDKEKMQFTYKGESIESKLEPSLDGLGDCKLTQRDALVVIGLFSPERYSIPSHLGYDITVMQDKYRSISILKNRLGLPNLKKGLYFDGASDTFKELPHPDSEEMRRTYEILKNPY